MTRATSAVALAVIAGQSAAAPLPTGIGECRPTRIAELASRLEGNPDSGSFVRYVNGGVQVSYEIVPGIQQSYVGDWVELCLVLIPEDCPPGDERGRVYQAVNLRTGASWEAPDAQHSCGGA